MSAYDFELVHRPGKMHQNADALSRLPLRETIEYHPQVGCVLMLEALPNPPLTADRVAVATQEDPTLSQLSEALHQGRVQKVTGENLNPLRKEQRSFLHRGCVTLGSRVVMPLALREQAMTTTSKELRKHVKLARETNKTRREPPLLIRRSPQLHGTPCVFSLHAQSKEQHF